MGHVPIQPPKATPHDYDLIVMAAPIWTGRIAPPLQSYLRQFRGDFWLKEIMERIETDDRHFA
jgi:hypothetical protein